MKAYVINLDSATERWEHMKRAFIGTGLELVRIPAVSGKDLKLPMPEFNEDRFRRCHGRFTNIFEVACYLSHIKAIKAFLTSGESHAMICEDDLHPREGAAQAIEQLMRTRGYWNIARLSGLSAGAPWKIASLGNGYSLNIQMGRLKGCGAYILDRKAAEELVMGLLPMWLPWDHAADREWSFGLHAVSVAPFPISQTEEVFTSAIQGNSQAKYPSSERWRFTYPYQIRNEISRWAHRGGRFLYLKSCFRWRSPFTMPAPRPAAGA